MLNHCRNLRHSLTLYGGATLAQAAETPLSDAQEFFQSREFTNAMKEREAQFKLQAAIIQRLDVLIKAQGRRR